MSRRGRDKTWNPYLAGALAGLLAIGSAYVTTRVTGRTEFLGASKTFVRASAALERAVLPARVAKNADLKDERLKTDWQLMLLGGLFLGALASALTGHAFEWEGVPELWRHRFGPGVLKRAAGAFLGGAVAMFGARLAGGCPFGHGLSGVMQLSVSGLAASLCFFMGGAMVAKYLSRKGDRYE